MRARNRIVAGVAALGMIGLAAAPASAIAYGGWTAGASVDTYYDDNLTRGLVVPSTALPYGNQDLGLNLGLSVGNVFLLTPEVDTWLIASVHGRAGVLYPSLSGAWGSLYSNTVWHLDAGREIYALLGSTGFWSAGWYHAAEAGFVQPLWGGASARVQLGGGTYLVDTADAGFTMPSVGVGFDQAWLTGTQVGLRYAYQTLFYVSRTDPRHQLYALASQRLGGGFEVHAQYLRTLNVSDTAGYTESYVGAGMGYEF
jgi:hypothetical protein